MTDFVPGLNDPSPVSRLLLTGFYDGATDGVMQLGDGGPVYLFNLADTPVDQDDERHYLLRTLPHDALDRLTAVIGEHIEPKWPTWVPIWAFPSDQVMADVDRRVGTILDQAGEPVWRITTSDTVQFGVVVAEQMQAAVNTG